MPRLPRSDVRSFLRQRPDLCLLTRLRFLSHIRGGHGACSGRPSGEAPRYGGRKLRLTAAADEAEKEAERVGQERDQSRQEREEARVRAASAEGEAARTLKQALEDARRPFWHRWLGWPS